MTLIAAVSSTKCWLSGECHSPSISGVVIRETSNIWPVWNGNKPQLSSRTFQLSLLYINTLTFFMMPVTLTIRGRKASSKHQTTVAYYYGLLIQSRRIMEHVSQRQYLYYLLSIWCFANRKLSFRCPAGFNKGVSLGWHAINQLSWKLYQLCVETRSHRGFSIFAESSFLHRFGKSTLRTCDLNFHSVELINI